MVKKIDRGRLGCVMGFVFWLFVLFTAWCNAEEVNLRGPAGFKMATPSRPAVITLRLTIKDATEKLYCPEVEWVWPNGTVSKEESDCDPYNTEDAKYQSWSRTIGLPGGEWLIRVRLSKAGKLLMTKEILIKVGGE